MAEGHRWEIKLSNNQIIMRLLGYEKMRLIEIFYSMQGEGPAMGRPATFVRLADCNLRCEGCDTDKEPTRIIALSALLEEIKLLGPRVVITGGEPTLQMAELSELISALHVHGYGDSHRDQRHQSH